MCLTQLGWAQNDGEPKDVLRISASADSAFTQARELAFDGNFEASRKVLDLLLLEDPGNYRYRLFRLQTLVWDKQYDAARPQIEALILEDTNAREIYNLRVRNELYAKDHDLCVRYCDDGIKRFKGDNEFFHVTKVQSLVSQNSYHDALDAVNLALDDYPDNNELEQLKTFLLNQLIVDGLTFGGFIDYFTKGYKPWLYGFAQYGKQTPVGAFIARVNVAERQQNFASFGVQGEIDAYPRLSRKSYMYLNVGYSPSQIFPAFRAGGEYYTMIGNTNFEGSLGMRYLDFLFNQVIMFTGSVGYYWGNEYVAFRPFVISDVYGVGTTYNFLYRKFFSGKGDFLQVTAGGGVIPDERVLSLIGNTANQDTRLDNQYVGIAYQRLANPSFYTRFDLIFTRQENFSRQDDYLGIITLGLTFGYRF